jgi:type IV pilus assembly protein PilA
MMKVHRDSKGFTLIELLIVIAIIGILAAIAIPAYTGYTKKSKVSGVVSAMGAVKNSIAAYYTEAGAVVNASGLTGAGSVGSVYGVDPPAQYINTMAVDTGGNITTTLTNIGSDVNGATLNLNTADFKLWTWSGSLPDAYKPK